MQLILSNRLEVSEPPQGAEAWKKAIFSAPCDYEPRQAFQSHSQWPSWHIEGSEAVASARNGAFL